MKNEHPILMNGEMVQAILGGRKTQTRRPVTIRDVDKRIFDYSDHAAEIFATMETCHFDDVYRGGVHFLAGPLIPCPNDPPCCEGYHHKLPLRCPFGEVGDRLWVREAFAGNPDGDRPYIGDASDTIYRADYSGPYESPFWSPSIHMPRTACRLVLRVEWVRVERVRDLTYEDACEEGMGFLPDFVARERFERVWDSIYGARGLGWQANPWVWVCGFSVAERKESAR